MIETPRNLIAAMLATTVEMLSLQRLYHRRHLERYPAPAGLDPQRLLDVYTRLLELSLKVAALPRHVARTVAPYEADLCFLWRRVVALDREVRAAGDAVIASLRAHAAREPANTVHPRILATFEGAQSTYRDLRPWKDDLPDIPSCYIFRTFASAQILILAARVEGLREAVERKLAAQQPK